MTTTMMTEKQRAALEAIEAVRRERLSLSVMGEPAVPAKRRERLGGMLSYYFRAPA
jgi:hypothetical protein